jgi:GT2 family glycosyltransferase
MLAGCLRMLRSSLDPADELIVVDSASTDASIRSVTLDHGAVYVRCDRPGASRARNEGWRRASHGVVAFVDDDVRVTADWARCMAGAFAGRPDVAFVTGRLTLPPGTGWTDIPISVKEDAAAATLDALTPGLLGHGANLAVRRDALCAVNGFDERLGAGAPFRAAEDNDLWDRLFAVGFVGRYEPGALAWHEQWRSRRELLPLNAAYGLGSGARIAKLLRADRRRARHAARTVYWDWGVRAVPGWLPRHRYAALLALIRALAAAVGLARALPVPLQDGHFRERRWGGPGDRRRDRSRC